MAADPFEYKRAGAPDAVMGQGDPQGLSFNSADGHAAKIAPGLSERSIGTGEVLSCGPGNAACSRVDAGLEVIDAIDEEAGACGWCFRRLVSNVISDRSVDFVADADDDGEACGCNGSGDGFVVEGDQIGARSPARDTQIKKPSTEQV